MGNTHMQENMFPTSILSDLLRASKKLQALFFFRWKRDLHLFILDISYQSISTLSGGAKRRHDVAPVLHNGFPLEARNGNKGICMRWPPWFIVVQFFTHLCNTTINVSKFLNFISLDNCQITLWCHSGKINSKNLNHLSVC
jgi:hypothetical protein